MFVINCKNYAEISVKNIAKFIKINEKISKKLDIPIVICLPQHLLGLAYGSVISIFAQHVDDKNIGSTTGYVIPELLKDSNISGSLINHSEHRIQSSHIKNLVSRLKKLDMISIVCVQDIAEVKKYIKFNPDYIAIEPPELIGSGKAISKEKPELILQAADIICHAKNTKLLCGAGIVSGDDVAKAIELGSAGVLVASGIIKAKNWEKTITEFSKSMI